MRVVTAPTAAWSFSIGDFAALFAGAADTAASGDEAGLLAEGCVFFASGCFGCDDLLGAGFAAAGVAAPGGLGDGFERFCLQAVRPSASAQARVMALCMHLSFRC
ncbi:MAG: hypothetical protein KC503_06100 [Myxococcales bacterium]|nr:hypothetical protein [Myxococcales bacterium]